MTTKQTLSPSEWQSVTRSLIELSERMEQATSQNAAPVSKAGGSGSGKNASAEKTEQK